MVHYFKQSCLLMLWALFLVNISFTSCDDKNPEVQIGELTPQKLYQTSWRGTGAYSGGYPFSISGDIRSVPS